MRRIEKTRKRRQEHFRFMDFPGELRNEVYAYLLSGNAKRSNSKYGKPYNVVITTRKDFEDLYGWSFINLAAFSGQREYEAFLTKVSAPCYKVAIDLFLVSKQISREALSVMYARNMFVFALLDTFVRFRNAIGPTNAASLRHVAIIDLGCLSKTAHQSLTEDMWFQIPDNPDARTNAFAGLSNLTDLELWWKPSAHTVDPNLAAHCIFFCARGFLDAVAEKEYDPFAAVERITVPLMSYPPYSNKQYLEEMRSKMRWLMTNAPETKYLQSTPELRDLEYELQAWKAMKLKVASRAL